EADAGLTTINVGDDHNPLLGFSLGNLNVTAGSGGHSKITVHDEGNSGPTSYSFAGFGSVSSLQSGFMGVTFDASTTGVTLNASQGDDTIRVVNSLPVTQVTINGGKGANRLSASFGPDTWTLTDRNTGDLNGVVRFNKVQNLSGVSNTYKFQRAGSIES